MLTTIRQKVIAAGVAVLALSAGTGITGLWVAHELGGALQRASTSAELVRSHMQADQMHDALRSDVLTVLRSNDPLMGVPLSESRKALSADEAEFRRAIAQSKTLANDPQVLATLNALADPLARYIEAATRIAETQAQDPLAALQLYPDFQKRFEALEVAMAKASDVIEAAAKADEAAAQAQTRLGRGLMTGSIVLGLLFGAGVILFALRTVLLPVLDLAADMRHLAAGRIDIALKGAERRDEVGEIARAVREFQEVIAAKGRAEAEEAERRRQAELHAEARDAEARLARAKVQAAVVESLADGLHRLSAGELDFRLREPFEADYEKLREDFNDAMARLEETMRTLIGSAEAIRSGALEIGGAADELSRRTEQQAASLEETAAALDEITATVRTSAEGAAQAQAAVAASKVDAEESGRVVREAVGAMSEIEESSRQISQIIGVIDEIAFQTNLLALNAGVEAARAGEAGKGFAVVASEVRGLAQRSADAAKEIKELISASSAQVEQGVGLVGRTGSALERIVAQVGEINQLVEEISTSSREQSTGLAQVNTAVNQMDQVTQQNAAMVEESTAATATLNQHVEQLFALVGQFRVSGAASTNEREAAAPARVALKTISTHAAGGGALRAAEPDGWQEF